MIFFYNLLICLLFPVYLLFFYPLSFFKKKWKKGFWIKLGFYKKKEIKNLYVFHCVSVGETLATLPILKKFVNEISDNVVFTITTNTAYNIAKEKIAPLVKEINFFPLDFPFSVFRFFYVYRPQGIIISETEIWPNIIFFSKIFKIPIIFINGRISDRSFKKYLKFRYFFKKILGYPFFIMQNEEYRERIIEIGAEREKTFVSGNIKYDVVERGAISKEEIGLKNDDLVVIAGSTHDGEEKIVLDVFKKLRIKGFNVKLIIAPRHPERFREVENLVNSYGFNLGKRSLRSKNWDVFILDTIGELSSFYSLSNIAFVGGSIANVGGHNILEPAYFSVPVIFGPNMSNFSDIRDEFLKKNAGFEVREENFYEILEKLIVDENLRREIGRRAFFVVKENQGSVQKTLDLIKRIINVP